MANVKMSAIGLLDMLRFKNMKVQRDKIIESTPATALVDTYASNRKAAERHPLSQSFTIEDIQVRGKGDVRTYTLRRNDGQNPAFFRAGQFVVIRQMIDGKLICRPVTLACGAALTLEGKIQLTVKRVEQDAFLSAYIHDNWKVGDTVETSGPQGTFFYEPLRDAKKVVAIAGGSGITPVYAMANAIADGDEDFDMTVLYGSRTKADILFQEEFDAIMARTDRVKLVNVLSEEEAEGCEHGFITAELIRKYAGDGVYSVFAAGSQGMYRFLDGEAEKLGLVKKYYRKELHDNTAQALLRAIRELAVNAIRHGKATSIKVAGELDADGLRCSVRDDGCGFDPDSCPGVLQGHFGLQGVRERAAERCGEVRILTSPGHGTKVTVSIRETMA